MKEYLIIYTSNSGNNVYFYNELIKADNKKEAYNKFRNHRSNSITNIICLTEDENNNITLEQ